MASDVIKFVGELEKVKPEYFRCIWIYLLRGSEVLASSAINENGRFALSLSREAAGAGTLQTVLGPAGMDQHLSHLPGLKPARVPAKDLGKAKEIRIPPASLGITESTLELWWRWCEWYCVSGYVVGQNGCPVPGAVVTVSSVGFDIWGFTTTPEVTV